MEKCILKIKLRAPGTQIPTSSPPDKSNATVLTEDTSATEITSSSEEYIPQSSKKNMKRKRGHKVYQKKGKAKLVKDPSSELVSGNTEDNFNSGQLDDDKLGSEIDPEPPNGSHTPSIMSNIETEVPNDRPPEKLGHGRVKVKLKSSRVSEAYRSSSDAQTPSEAEKSNPYVIPNMVEAAAEKEESTYSDGQTSEMHNAVFEKLPRKTGSIKIKSTRGIGFSSETMNDRNLGKLVIPSQMASKKNSVAADTERTLDSSSSRNLRRRDRTLPYKDPRYNDKELSAALAVIKKVMKMDAAVPFNTPVDPVALGIPDYFDIIENPMDFGTISNNLENRLKYMNSEDVFRDVRYIWDNCYKYNNKGDYVVDLMRRVKKNFTKYWQAAGLFSDPGGAPESTQIEEDSRSGLGQQKLYPKSKSKHKRRRYGIDKHKSDCLCAVCVVRRRRKEREENSAAVESQPDASDFNTSRELKQQENSPVDIPFSEDATSSLDHSNADGEEADDGDEKLGNPYQLGSVQMEKQETDTEMELDPNENVGNDQSPHRSVANGIQDSKLQFLGQYTEATRPGEETDATILQNGETSAQHYLYTNEKQQLQEPCEQTQLIKSQEGTAQQENHLVLQLCSSLFPRDPRSIWNGPHSLNRRDVSFRNSPIHSALETFMKKNFSC